MPDGNVDNLIVGAGYVFRAPIGTTEPTDDQVHVEPTSPWVNLGFTEGGVQVDYDQDIFEAEVDQVADRIGSFITGRSWAVSTSLAEATLDNYERILNGGTTATGTAGSGVDYKTFEPVADPMGAPTYFMLLFDGLAPEGFRRRVLVRKALQIGSVGTGYEKDGQTLYPVEFAAHYVSNSVVPVKIIDQIGAAA